jgi:hypothetical protein
MATTKADIGFILLRLADAYGKTLDERTVNLYYQSLFEYHRMVLVHTAAELMKTSKWFPRISEIILEAEKHKNQYVTSQWYRLDEAAQWYMYRRNISHTDDLTDDDIEKIYALAGLPMDEPLDIPPEYQAQPPGE